MELLYEIKEEEFGEDRAEGRIITIIEDEEVIGDEVTTEMVRFLTNIMINTLTTTTCSSPTLHQIPETNHIWKRISLQHRLVQIGTAYAPRSQIDNSSADTYKPPVAAINRLFQRLSARAGIFD